MEYIYAAMLLHKAGQKVTEEAVKKVLTAAGVKVDEARVRALVAALEGVDIDKAIESAAMPIVAAAAPSSAPAAGGHKAEAKKEEKKEEETAAGLGALFG